MKERPRSSAFSKKNTLLAGALAMGAVTSQMEGCAPPTNLRDQAAYRNAEHINLELSDRLNTLQRPYTEYLAHEVRAGLQPGSPEYIAFADFEETARDVHGIAERAARERIDQEEISSIVFRQAYSRGSEWISHTIATVDRVRNLDDHAESRVFFQLARMAQSPNIDPRDLREFAHEIHVTRSNHDSRSDDAAASHRLDFTATQEETALAIETLHTRYGNIEVSDSSLRSVSVREAHYLARVGITDSGGQVIDQLITQHPEIPEDTLYRMILRNSYQAEAQLYIFLASVRAASTE